MRGFAWGFALLGLASSVGNVGNQRYLTDITPRGAVHGLIMAANALAAITGLAPLGVAWLLEHYELERLLWAAAGVAIAALLASGLLVESRVRVRAALGAWRTRNNPLRVS
jgi:MFS family permease